MSVSHLALAAVALLLIAATPLPAPTPTDRAHTERQAGERQQKETEVSSQAPPSELHETPHGKTAAATSDQNADRHDAEAERWWKLQDSLVGAAWFGARVALLVGIGSLGILVLSWNTAKRSTVAAEESNRVAKLALQGDRPWISIEPDGDPKEFVDRPSEVGPPSDGVVGLVVGYSALNVGRNSPAWITSEAFSCVFTTLPCPFDLPTIADESDSPDRLGSAPISSGKKSKAGEVIFLTPDQCKTILEGKAAVALYGVVKYRDVFNDIHETGFCWLYERPSMPTGYDPNGNRWVGETAWAETDWIILHGPNTYFRFT